MAGGKTGEGHDRSYDAVVVGAGNGGLAAALELAVKGARPLLIEQHNMPGGFASSFVRGRFEFEISLHELSEVGPEEDHGNVRRFLNDEAGVDVEWVAIPEAYRVILPGMGINARLPFGVKEFTEAAAAAAPESHDEIAQYIEHCVDTFEMLGFLGKMASKPDIARLGGELVETLRKSGRPAGEIADMTRKAGNFMRTAGYTVEEVTNTFGLSERAKAVIYPYWCYLGVPMNRLAFPIWAGMLTEYLLHGAWVPRMRSQEMTAAMDARIRELGGAIEYNTQVKKILVEKGRVTGVETSAGEVIKTSCVVSNASPSLVYHNLISPADAVPAAALRFANARKVGPSGFIVYLGLDASPQELGLSDYGYFISDNMDTPKLYDAVSELGPTKMQATTCLNNAIPDCSPPGTTMLCITILHQPEAWADVSPRDYFKTKNRIASQLIDQLEQATGADVRNHIEEIEIATPATFARYTGAFNGSIYGYEQDPWDSVLVRLLTVKDEDYIEGLEFAGGFAAMGHGYSPSIMSGRMAALKALATMGVKS